MPRRRCLKDAARTAPGAVLVVAAAVCAAVLPAVPVLGGEDGFVAPRRAAFRGWPAYVLKNEWVRLHVVPEVGGRVMQFALGEKDFFWVNPELAGQAPPKSGLGPDGGWLNYGGDKLWPAPQGWDNEQQWPGPPDAVLDGRPYRAEADLQPAGIRLTSGDDPRSGIRFSRTIRLDPRSTHVAVEATMTNIDRVPRRWGIWAHTQLDAGRSDSHRCNRRMRAFCPINPKSHFPRGYRVIFGKKDNPSFQVDKSRGLMRVSYQYRVGKIGLDSPAGWVATVDGRRGDVFVQRFTYEPDKQYPDGSSVEFWHNGAGRFYAYNKWIELPADTSKNPCVFESEILSPFARLEPGQRYRWTYHWYACRVGGDYPILDCSNLGVTCEKLQLARGPKGLTAGGRFGVFRQAGARLVLLDEDARPVTAGETVQVTPLKPLIVDRSGLADLPAVPEAAVRAVLQLRSPEGELLGTLAQCDLQ